MNKKLQGQIRHLLTVGAGYLVATGKLTELDAGAITGIVMAIIAMIWSWKSPEKKDA